VTIGLNIWLVPKVGYFGSAWATLAAYVVMTIISYSLMRKHHPMPYDLAAIGQYVLLAIVLVSTFEFVNPGGWMKYAGGLGVILLFILFAFQKEKKHLRLNDNG